MSTSSKLVTVGMALLVVTVLALEGDVEFFASVMKILTAFSRVPG